MNLLILLIFLLANLFTTLWLEMIFIETLGLFIFGWAFSCNEVSQIQKCFSSDFGFVIFQEHPKQFLEYILKFNYSFSWQGHNVSWILAFRVFVWAKNSEASTCKFLFQKFEISSRSWGVSSKQNKQLLLVGSFSMAVIGRKRERADARDNELVLYLFIWYRDS